MTPRTKKKVVSVLVALFVLPGLFGPAMKGCKTLRSEVFDDENSSGDR